MRGSPFTFSTFALGLNVLDSPYMLKQGETRDCLNVVSSPKGAARKRYGSEVFASGAAAYFPTLAVTDTFERANEAPLKKDGKGNEAAWKEIGAEPTGEILSNAWVSSLTTQKQGAYYSVAEQTNPAVSLEFEATALEEKTWEEKAIEGKSVTVAVLAAVNAASTTGYEVRATKVGVGGFFRVEIRKLESGNILLAKTEEVFVSKDRLGITVRAGSVVAWKYQNSKAAWKQLTSAEDSKYTKGFSGFKGYSTGGAEGNQVRLKNFTTGEAPAPPAENEFLSLLVCKTKGGNFLIANSGTKLFSITEAGEITEIGSGFTEGKRWSILQAEPGRRVEIAAKKATEYKGSGVAYLSNGTDAPQVWPGLAKNTAVEEWKSKPEGEFVAVPKAKYLVYHGGRVWAAGIAEKEEAVQWSGEATESAIEYPDPTDWPKANINFFEPGDGHAITALGTVNNYVLVFKAHRTWVIFDLNEGENRQISDRIGCIANRSVVETHMGTFFLTDDQGVYLTNGTTMKDVSKQIRPLLQGYDTVPAPGSNKERKDRAADLTQIENAAAEFLDGHYYLTYVALDGSTKTLDYDTLLNSWWLHDLGGNQWAHWQAMKQPALYTIPKGTKKGVVKAFARGIYQDSGKNYTGKAFEVQEKNEEYATITLTAYWASSWEPFWQYFMRHRFQQPQIKKRIRTLFLDGTGEVEGYAYRNFETVPQRLKGTVEKKDIATESTYTPKLGESLTKGEKTYQPVRFYSLGTARIWSFMFANATAEGFEFDTYAADLYFRKA